MKWFQTGGAATVLSLAFLTAHAQPSNTSRNGFTVVNAPGGQISGNYWNVPVTIGMLEKFLNHGLWIPAKRSTDSARATVWANFSSQSGMCFSSTCRCR